MLVVEPRKNVLAMIRKQAREFGQARKIRHPLNSNWKHAISHPWGRRRYLLELGVIAIQGRPVLLIIWPGSDRHWVATT
jgi:hypothetical protein